MKRSTLFLTTLAVLLYLSVIPAFAQHGGHGGGAAGGHGAASTHSEGNSHNGGTEGSRASRPTVADHLEDNTRLASKLNGLLPAGTNLQLAAQGFKNLGQFVAAVHVSKNLGIPFEDLKAKMMGPGAMSLGKAIQALDPKADAKAETKKARQEAKEDMKESEEHESGS